MLSTLSSTQSFLSFFILFPLFCITFGLILYLWQKKCKCTTRLFATLVQHLTCKNRDWITTAPLIKVIQNKNETPWKIHYQFAMHLAFCQMKDDLWMFLIHGFFERSLCFELKWYLVSRDDQDKEKERLLWMLVLFYRAPFACLSQSRSLVSLDKEPLSPTSPCSSVTRQQWRDIQTGPAQWKKKARVETCQWFRDEINFQIPTSFPTVLLFIFFFEVKMRVYTCRRTSWLNISS